VESAEKQKTEQEAKWKVDSQTVREVEKWRRAEEQKSKGAKEQKCAVGEDHLSVGDNLLAETERRKSTSRSSPEEQDD